MRGAAVVAAALTAAGGADTAGTAADTPTMSNGLVLAAGAGGPSNGLWLATPPPAGAGGASNGFVDGPANGFDPALARAGGPAKGSCGAAGADTNCELGAAVGGAVGAGTDANGSTTGPSRAGAGADANGSATGASRAAAGAWPLPSNDAVRLLRLLAMAANGSSAGEAPGEAWLPAGSAPPLAGSPNTVAPPVDCAVVALPAGAGGVPDDAGELVVPGDPNIASRSPSAAEPPSLPAGDCPDRALDVRLLGVASLGGGASAGTAALGGFGGLAANTGRAMAPPPELAAAAGAADATGAADDAAAGAVEATGAPNPNGSSSTTAVATGAATATGGLAAAFGTGAGFGRGPYVRMCSYSCSTVCNASFSERRGSSASGDVAIVVLMSSSTRGSADRSTPTISEIISFDATSALDLTSRSMGTSTPSAFWATLADPPISGSEASTGPTLSNGLPAAPEGASPALAAGGAPPPERAPPAPPPAGGDSTGTAVGSICGRGKMTRFARKPWYVSTKRRKAGSRSVRKASPHAWIKSSAFSLASVASRVPFFCDSFMSLDIDARNFWSATALWSGLPQFITSISTSDKPSSTCL